MGSIPTARAKKRLKQKLMDKVKLYLSESYDELVNKVSWPTMNELIESGKVVVSFILISTVCVFFMDVICQQALKLIYNVG